MIEVAFAAPTFGRLFSALLASSEEAAAIVFARVVERQGHLPRLLVTRAEPATPGAYTRRSATMAELSPSTVLQAARRAQHEGLALVFVHSHPFAERADFSTLDDRGEIALAGFLNGLCSGVPHCAIVVARSTVAARRLGTREPVRIVEIGELRRVLTAERGGEVMSVHERQVRALGPDGQRILSRLAVGVVGAGGIGSLVSQQLVYLGIGRIILMDHDVIDITNLNRVVGATEGDAGVMKVRALSRAFSRIRVGATVEGIEGSVFYAKAARILADLDVLFLCTDNHGSRAVVGQLAYQYLIPTIDVGGVVRVVEGRVTHIAGRVQLLSPGLGCLVCNNILDSDQVRHDLMTAEQRGADPYFQGDSTPQPSVISFNSVLAGSAVSMFLHVITGVGTAASVLLYDGLRGTIRHAVGRREENCVVCSERGVLGGGDAVPLPARQA